MKRWLLISGSITLLIVCAIGLVGCSGIRWQVKVSCDQDNPQHKMTCHAEGSAGGSIGGGGAQSLMAAMGVSSTPDAGSFSIDISQSETPYPSSGQVTVTLSSSGTTLAASQFPYVKSGTTLVLSNPAAVNNWAANYPSANQVNYAIVPFTPSESYGDHVIAAASVYQGTQTASASSSYTNCSPPGVRSPYPCTQY